MSAQNDGGSAFPVNSDEWDHHSERFRPTSEGGMTLRDYFAAKALPQVHAEYVALGEPLVRSDYEHIAADAYLLADLMLKARDA